MSVAVTVAVWSEVNWPALALKIALVEPAAAVTDGGTVTVFESDFRAIVNPPGPADPVSITVQVVTALEPKEFGAQPKALMEGIVTLIILPLAETGIESPPADAPNVSETSIVAAVLPAKVTET